MRVRNFIFTLLLALTLSFSIASCSSCSNDKEVVPEQTERFYDFDKVIAEDYDYIASQYKVFRFLEADGVFVNLVSEDADIQVESVTTVFQVLDTCIQIIHDKGKVDSLPTIVKVNDIWLECSNINARNPITLDSAMKIAAPYIELLDTRHLTLRKVVGPPYPDHAEYIFGDGLMFIDASVGSVRGYIFEEDTLQ